MLRAIAFRNMPAELWIGSRVGENESGCLGAPPHIEIHTGLTGAVGFHLMPFWIGYHRYDARDFESVLD